MLRTSPRETTYAPNTNLLRLLAVDDNDNSGELIVRAALRCGYEAFAILDAEFLEGAANDWQPHVVTLDLCMPGLDKLEIIWRLKRTRFDGRLIVVSGQAESIRIEAISLASANGFREAVQMGKPVQLAQLRDLLAVVRANILAPALAGEAGRLVAI